MATRTTTKKAEPKTTTAKTAIEKEAPAKLAAEPETITARMRQKTSPSEKKILPNPGKRGILVP
nr:hypothetical protein [uncultured Blautia sp.]